LPSLCPQGLPPFGGDPYLNLFLNKSPTGCRRFAPAARWGARRNKNG